jgi:hypothetical protein
MTNFTPDKESNLLTSSQDLATGEESIGAEVGVAQNTNGKVLGDINDLIGKRAGYEIAKNKLSEYRQAIRSVFEDGKIYIGLTRDVFKPRWGNEFTGQWKMLGFEDSLALPSTPAQMQLVVKTIQKYLTDNPTTEVAALNITGAHAQMLLDQLSAARGAVYNQEMVVGLAKEARDASADKLRRRYRGFIDELSQLMGPLDQRWKVFGLNLPGATAIAEIVEGLKATLIGPTAVALKWDASARAEYYRVFKKVIGVDAEFVAVGSPADLDMTLEGLPSNATVEIYVVAVNNGGECQPSAKVTITTH